MKQFFINLFAVLVGLLVYPFILLSFFILTLSVVGLFFDNEEPEPIAANSVLHLEIDGQFVTYSPEEEGLHSILELLGEANPFLSSLKKQSVVSLLSSIERAKNDDNISGIFLQFGAPVNLMPASILQIREALKDFRSSGKFVTASGDSYTPSTYHLASVADQVYLTPEGSLFFNGLSATRLYFSEGLTKLGVTMRTYKVGKYKSAIEPFTLTGPSESDQEQTTALLDDLWKVIRKDVSTSRNLSTSEVDRIANDEFLVSAERLVELGLIDDLLYKRKVIEKMADLVSESDLSLVSPQELLNSPSGEETDLSQPSIAVLFAEGSIADVPPGSDQGYITSKNMLKAVEEIKENNDIKAVVLYVNSPGGSAFSSERIWQALHELSQEKPLVTYMGDLAASGGYYLASAGSTIVASPNTITGSIGVFGLVPNVRVLAGKAGIQMHQTKTHKNSGFMAEHLFAEEISPATTAALQKQTARTYNLFLKRCASARGKSIKSINAVAQGRVWSGERAKKVGLVDELGSLNRAIAIAAETAEASTFNVSHYPKASGDFPFNLSMIGQLRSTILNQIPFASHLLNIQELSQVGGVNNIRAQLPYTLIIE